MKKIIYFSVFGLIILISGLSYASASEVPFEVIKTKVTASDVDSRQNEVVVVNGIPYDTTAEGENLGYPPPKGEYDHRVKVPITGVKYTFEFWNVGEMGGEKGFIFKTDYGKAKLTVSYETGQAYKMVSTGKKFGDIEMQEKKEVSTPDIKDTVYDLTFTGGPYGIFNYKDKKGVIWRVAHIADGKHIIIDTIPEKKTLMREEYASPEITNSSAFEKWLEILNPTIACNEIDNPDSDSGIRFSDYDGEVSVFPCGDIDSIYGAELDMVLHNKDVIWTHDDSTCVLSLADMTSFVMKPNSQIILGGTSEKSKLHLIAGKVWANVKRMIKDGTMDVEMSQAVAGIKGTTFVVEDDGQTSTLKVIEGHVKFTSKTTGKSEMIGPGETISATKEGLGKKKTFDIIKENKVWEDVKQHKYIKKKKIDNQLNKNINSMVLWGVVILVVLSGGYFGIYRYKK